MSVETSPDQDNMAKAAGLHLGAAIAHFLAIALEGKSTREEVREDFLRLAQQMWDDTADGVFGDVGEGPLHLPVAPLDS